MTEEARKTIHVVIGGSGKDYQFSRNLNTPNKLKGYLKDKHKAKIPWWPKIFINDKRVSGDTEFKAGAKIEYQKKWGGNG